jgi:hypothetical protein
MMASLSLLSGLVATALVLTICTPVLLVWLFIKDYKKGELW